MTVAGGIPTVAAHTHVSWGVKFDLLVERFWDGLMGSLCRASRGYLCPPDMHRVMFPDVMFSEKVQGNDESA